MKKFMICAIALFLLLSTSVFGDTLPAMYSRLSEKCILKQMASPGHKTTDIIANFAMNGFTKNVWFNVRGQW